MTGTITEDSSLQLAARATGPLLTHSVHAGLLAAARAGADHHECSLDLMRSQTRVEIGVSDWGWSGARYPYPATCKERTIYRWDEDEFVAIARFGGGGLIKLVRTDWGPPTFEIDGIKMLPTAQVSPYADAARKVGLVQPRGRKVLDTCGGLGYFAAHCIEAGASEIHSFEKNADVIWLRSLNPWSPDVSGVLRLTHGDIVQAIRSLPDSSFGAILHDPPRFGIAGELYSQDFYHHLARVIERRGRLFHYTGTPNKLTSGRDVPNEVSKRLQVAGFKTDLNGDGVVGVRR